MEFSVLIVEELDKLRDGFVKVLLLFVGQTDLQRLLVESQYFLQVFNIVLQ
jgi:hypothetical protein